MGQVNFQKVLLLITADKNINLVQAFTKQLLEKVLFVDHYSITVQACLDKNVGQEYSLSWPISTMSGYIYI